MRLIDADELVKFLKGCTMSNGTLINTNAMLSVIDKMPTAYDVEKVVEELEERKTQYGKLQFAHNDANMVYVYVGKEQAIDCAIDIVRKGGVE